MAETGQPIKLIDIDETDEQFEVSGEAMAFLASLPRDKKIKVIEKYGNRSKVGMILDKSNHKILDDLVKKNIAKKSMKIKNASDWNK